LVIVRDRSLMWAIFLRVSERPTVRGDRKEILEALKKESELARREMIRRHLKLPPDRRTHFLRVPWGQGSCL
jgi:hypothetical protein